MKYRVNINRANRAKHELGKELDGNDNRVLNRVGAFSSLFLLDLGQYFNPVLVLKTEEPGSKQVLALQHGRVESICFDMINHLINDCIVMGAEPLAVQDLIICETLDRNLVTRIVSACAKACRAQGCALTGGETSEQPGILSATQLILGSNIVGVVERSQIIDGSNIAKGDVIIALASSGPHTNGYTLIRDLMQQNQSLAFEPVDDTTFLEAVLKPHRCYYPSLKGLFSGQTLKGLAHITGGGIRENLNRILPENLDAHINLSKFRTPQVFSVIRKAGRVSSSEMLRIFNLGIGMIAVCRREDAKVVMQHLTAAGEHVYPIGEVKLGTGKVLCNGAVDYGAY